MPDLPTDHSKATLEGAHSHGPARRYVSSRADRPTSFDPAEIPAPGGREEEWRFTPMKRFKPLFDLDAVTAGTATDAVALSVDAPEGVTVETLAAGDLRLGTVGAPSDRTSVVAWNAVSQATAVTVTAGTELASAVRVTVVGSDSGLASPSALGLLVTAEAGSKGTVVIDHTGTAALTETVEVVVADGAELTLVTVQGWEDEAVHASNHRVRVEGRGTLKHVVVSLGGDVRVSPDLGFSGEGGHIDAFGVYFTDAGQHQEHRHGHRPRPRPLGPPRSPHPRPRSSACSARPGRSGAGGGAGGRGAVAARAAKG